MSKSKSQWDFGELFPADATRKVLSVSELTAQVRRLLEKQVGSIWVTGEVTNLRAQSSGHIYFTLKDAASQLGCVLFSREKVAHRELLADGQKVLLQGEVTGIHDERTGLIDQLKFRQHRESPEQILHAIGLHG